MRNETEFTGYTFFRFISAFKIGQLGWSGSTNGDLLSQ
jgi:hypothetical protein